MNKIKKYLPNLKYSFIVLPKSIKYIWNNPKIWILIVAPFLINLFISVVLFGVLQAFLRDLIEAYLEGFFQGWLSFLVPILKTIAVILSLAVSIWGFVLLGMIVAAPFNGVIIERILDENNIENMVHYKGVKLVTFEIWRATKFALIKLFLSITVFIVTFVLNFIPVVGSALFVIINFSFLAFINTLDLADPAQSRKYFSVKGKIKNLFRNFDLYVIFAIITAFIIEIPIINFLYLPIASISATFLVIRQEERVEN